MVKVFLHKPYYLIVITIFLIKTPAFATTMLFMDKYQLAEESTQIVTGSVKSNHSFFNNDRSMIYTETQIEIARNIKGDVTPSQIITVISVGGSVGDMEMKVFGEAAFENNEKVLLFLKPLHLDTRTLSVSTHSFEIPGRVQGKFNVFEGNNGEEMIYNTYPDVELVSQNMNGQINKVNPNTDSMSLESFVEDLH